MKNCIECKNFIRGSYTDNIPHSCAIGNDNILLSFYDSIKDIPMVDITTEVDCYEDKETTKCLNRMMELLEKLNDLIDKK